MIFECFVSFHLTYEGTKNWKWILTARTSTPVFYSNLISRVRGEYAPRYLTVCSRERVERKWLSTALTSIPARFEQIKKNFQQFSRVQHDSIAMVHVGRMRGNAFYIYKKIGKRFHTAALRRLENYVLNFLDYLSCDA